VSPTGTDDLTVHLPGRAAGGFDQDAEWCEVSNGNDRRRRIRFHDYADIYAIPGLYERLFYEELRCQSPRVLRELVQTALERLDTDATSVTALDLGAGNGMVAEELVDLGVGSIVGFDILPEAEAAAERDRPGVYDDYHVVDLTSPTAETLAALRSAPFDMLVCVAALGFGDIPPRAFKRALDAIADGGLVAFTIKDRFLEEGDESGYSRLVRRMLESGKLEPVVQRRYRHRLSAAGDPLHYVAIVAVKRG
jgi:predicted TPR repeat methyltransferase